MLLYLSGEVGAIYRGIFALSFSKLGQIAKKAKTAAGEDRFQIVNCPVSTHSFFDYRIFLFPRRDEFPLRTMNLPS
jgi:hypothetical protein